MAEAIFAKYSKSTGGGTVPPELVISNSTKSALGLNSDATLDDCLSMVALKDSEAATIQVTLKDIDGTPLGGHQIRMQDATGFNLTYTLDGSGSCVFKTTNGQAIFYDESNNGWIDIGYPNSGAVDLPLGSVKKVIMQRYKKLHNGWYTTFSNSQWINFSKYADTAELTLMGGSGEAGFPMMIDTYNVYLWNKSSNTWGCGIRNNSTHSVVLLKAYNLAVDIDSNRSCFDQTINTHIFNVNYHNFIRGGNGEKGKTVTKTVSVSNQCKYAVIGKGGRWYRNNNEKNIGVNRMINFQSPFINLSENVINLNTSTLIGQANVLVGTVDFDCSANGNTGGSTSLYGHSASGGRGGEGGKEGTVNSYTGGGNATEENKFGRSGLILGGYLKVRKTNIGNYYLGYEFYINNINCDMGYDSHGSNGFIRISKFRYK